MAKERKTPACPSCSGGRRRCVWRPARHPHPGRGGKPGIWVSGRCQDPRSRLEPPYPCLGDSNKVEPADLCPASDQGGGGGNHGCAAEGSGLQFDGEPSLVGRVWDFRYRTKSCTAKIPDASALSTQDLKARMISSVLLPLLLHISCNPKRRS